MGRGQKAKSAGNVASDGRKAEAGKRKAPPARPVRSGGAKSALDHAGKEPYVSGAMVHEQRRHYTEHSGGFQRWWNDYALSTRAAGGSVNPVDEEVAHTAWVTSRRRRQREQVIMALVFGCVIGLLIADRVMNPRKD